MFLITGYFVDKCIKDCEIIQFISYNWNHYWLNANAFPL